MLVATPIPDRHLHDAARLWVRAFPPWPRLAPLRIRACHAIAAIGTDGVVIGVAGFRDHDGGILHPAPMLAGLLYRPAPPTDDLVIDGIVAARPRQGIGRALLAAAADVARRSGRPALRAEVALRNRSAMAFYAAMGFAEADRGAYGWPWCGTVAILRRPL